MEKEESVLSLEGSRQTINETIHSSSRFGSRSSSSHPRSSHFDSGPPLSSLLSSSEEGEEEEEDLHFARSCSWKAVCPGDSFLRDFVDKASQYLSFIGHVGSKISEVFFLSEELLFRCENICQREGNTR